jgi:ribosomal protein S17
MSNYYTPEIEDFHVGFEFEQFEDYDVPGKEKEWHKWVFGKNGSDNPENMNYPCPFGINNKTIRVKCLDQEDFESLGFSKVEEKDPNIKAYEKELSFDAVLIGDTLSVKQINTSATKNWVLIDVIEKNTGEEVQCYFNGKIRNKSELSIVLKLIGFKNQK